MPSEATNATLKRLVEGMAELAADLILAGEIDSVPRNKSDPDAILRPDGT